MEDGRWKMAAHARRFHPQSSILHLHRRKYECRFGTIFDCQLPAVCAGLLGVIMRRNLLVIYMSLELMLNAANLSLVSFSRFNDNLNGQILVFFIITVAAAEVSVGLALIVALYRRRQSAHVEDLTTMKL